MSVQEILAKFIEAGWSGTIYRKPGDARKALEAEEPYKPVMCNYKGRLRPLHPKVCEWHKERNDTEWLRHSLAMAGPEGPVFTHKSVMITRYQPKERKY